MLVLPQSKLVENTARILQSKIDMEKCDRDWICSQNLVSSSTQTKFYKGQSQYFPTNNFPPLESEASLLDLSSKGKCSIPMKKIEIWEKRACKLMAINSHENLFSSAACLCMQQQTMSMPALSRLLEAVAKSIKHATAMSTILVTEIFQTRRDADTADIQKKPSVRLRTAGLSVHGLTVRNVPVGFHTINECNSSIRLHAISLFPYLDDWIIRDLICNRLTLNILFKLHKIWVSYQI